MNNNDKANFQILINSLSVMYGQKEKPATMLISMMFNALAGYSLEQVTLAANKHVAKSKFFPRPADLVEILDGTDLTPDQVIAAARLAKTPMGILCRIQIGTYDLENADAFKLKQRAEECLQILPEWTARAARGHYSDHEIAIMLKHRVDPAGPFAFGLSPPSDLTQLQGRCHKIADSKKYLALTAPLSDPIPDVEPQHSRIKNIVMDVLNEPSTEKPKKYSERSTINISDEKRAESLRKINQIKGGL